MENTFDEDRKERFVEYVVETYRPQIEDALIDYAMYADSHPRSVEVLQNLEDLVGTLRNGGDLRLEEGKLELGNQTYVEKCSDFVYHPEKYKDVMDFLKDFQDQVSFSNREMAEVIKGSYRVVSDARKGPPYEVSRRKLLAMEKRAGEYVDRISDIIHLDRDSQEHFRSLPAVHKDHMIYRK